MKSITYPTKIKKLFGLKKLWQLGLIAVVYFLAFFFLEQREGSIHIIGVSIDYRIPFCEYFIVPYLLWFPYVAACVVFFCIKGKETEYARLMKSLVAGMAVFVLFSLLYPNGQELRPTLAGDNIFQQMVMKLYEADTSTNIFPSLHVFNSIVCCIAIFRNMKDRRFWLLRSGTLVLTVLIVLATLFLKQHSVLDVLGAILLNMLCYRQFYEQEELVESAGRFGRFLRKRRFRRIRE